METIEERATKYACDGCMPDGIECDSCYNIHGKCERDAYIAGAKAEREELLRWHDPKEELPKDDRDVLVKTALCARYCIAFYKANGARNYHWHENNGPIDDDMVIGWHPIHEL